MKHWSIKLAVVLLFGMLSENADAQRNRWSNGIEWHMLRGEKNAYRIFFPTGMEPIAREVSAELAIIVPLYSEKLFRDSMLVVRKDSLGCEDIKRDSLGKPIVTYELKSWRPDSAFVIVLYANPQRFNEQMLVHIILPPGILGFTELFTERIAFPYGGNDHEFRQTLAHEIVHAFERFFVKKQAERFRQMGYRYDESPTLPLWSTEGFAEYGSSDVYLDSLQEQNDYRRARTEMRNVIFVMNEEEPSLELLALTRDFGNYSFGYNFHHFMAERFGSTVFARLRSLVARDQPFKDSVWEATFQEPLAVSEAAWNVSMRKKYYGQTFFQVADSVSKRILTEKTTAGISLVQPDGNVGFDPRTERMVFYESTNKKWGVDVATFGFDTGYSKTTWDEIEIAHQFDDKTLWYRLGNPPAIFGDRVAIVLSKIDGNAIRLYRMENGKSNEEREYSIPELPWIKGLRFLSRDTLIFVGFDTTGEQNIYTFNLATEGLQKLTHDSFAKDAPGFVNGSLFYIESGGFRDMHYLVTNMRGTSERVCLDSVSGFVDQWVADSSRLVMRILQENGVPLLYLWKIGDSRAYRYRYGDGTSIKGKTESIQYPFVDQLIGFRKNGTFLLHETRSKSATNGRFVEIRFDTSPLQGTEVRMEEMQTFVRRGNFTLPVEAPDRSRRYRTMLSSEDTYTGMGEIVSTDATGEHGFAGHLYLGTQQVFANTGVHWFDFSKRLMTQTGITMSATPQFYRSPATGRVDVLKRGVMEVERRFTWPFDLENKISVALSAGFILHQPPDSVAPGIQNLGGALNNTKQLIPQPAFLELPFVQLNAVFVSDGTFLDDLRSTRHGHRYTVSLVTTNGVIGKFGNRVINMTLSADARYYWRPWQSRAYLAMRAGYGISRGHQPYAFFLPELYRTPGFLNFEWEKNFGNTFLLYTIEARFPFLRTFIVDYEFWEHRNPFWFFSFSVAPFLYGGTTNWIDDPFQFTHRGGIALKTGIFGWFPLYLRFEEYHYLNGGPWYPAWSIEIEY
ncbi:MAG: hypothetical protein AAB631_00935 [Patescibacteria group bacterium]